MGRRVTMVLLVSAALAFAGCGRGPSRVDQAAIADAQALWSADGPHVYEVWYEGDVDGREQSDRVLVDRDLGTGEDQRFAIDRLFAELADRLARGESVRANFDGRFGYPTQVRAEEFDVASKSFSGNSRSASCPGAEADGPTDLAAEPTERVFNADLYSRWHDDSGCPVRTDVITTFAGAAHCNEEQLEFLLMGDPIGAITTGATSLHYIRDPLDVLGGFDDIDRSRTVNVDHLPASAIDTGLRRNDSVLWLDPTKPTLAYLVTDGTAAEFTLDPNKHIMCM